MLSQWPNMPWNVCTLYTITKAGKNLLTWTKCTFYRSSTYFNLTKLQITYLQGGYLSATATIWTSNKILESHWTLEDFVFYCKNWWSYYQDTQLLIKRTWALRALLEKYSLLSIRQEDKDDVAANTSLTNLEYRIMQFYFSLQSRWYERIGLQQELHKWSGICKKCLLNLLTVFVICQEKSWLHCINIQIMFSDSLKLAKGMDLCNFVAHGISYPRVSDLALLNCFFIISLLFSVQNTVKGQCHRN